MLAGVRIYLGILAALAIAAIVIVFIANGGHYKVLHPFVSATTGGTVMTVHSDDGKPVVAASPIPGQPPRTERHSHTEDVYAGLLAVTASMLVFLATGLGLSLASENDGHLEFALTRPVTRERYALGIVAVDLAGMGVAFLISLPIAVLAVLGCGAGEVFTHSTTSASDIGKALLMLGLPILMYAWILAISASLRRGRAFAILIWPAMLVLAIFAHQPTLIQPEVAWLNEYLNPLEIFSNNEHAGQLGWTLYGLASAAVLGALAVAQWRRLEA
jgi:hypothetical protein